MLADIKSVAALSKVGAGTQELRGGEFGQALAGVLPEYYELVSRGLVFSGATAATGVAPGTAIGTTGAFTLANPLGSAKKLVVLASSMGYVSGTIGAGVVWYLGNTNPAAAAVSGTAITVTNSYLGGGGSGNVGRAFTTSTLPVNPTILRPAWSLTALLATTAVQPYLVTDHVNGEFMIAPGCALTLHATAAAGSTPIVAFGMTWAEFDV